VGGFAPPPSYLVKKGPAKIVRDSPSLMLLLEYYRREPRSQLHFVKYNRKVDHVMNQTVQVMETVQVLEGGVK
jgi:hypothetical protein